MSPKLLERDQYLAQLNGLLREAAHGNGRCVLIGGEAGIGQTTLLEYFAEKYRTDARPLWGRCEALFTPRPLGPLYDIAPLLDGMIDVLINHVNHEANWATVFSQLLSALQAGTAPTTVILSTSIGPTRQPWT